MKAFIPMAGLAALIAGALISPAAAADRKVDFAKDVVPILQARCLECHGPDKQKGKLRLDLKAEAFKESTIIVAGKADESDLVKLISLPKDHDDIMPNKGEPLTAEQIALIRDWINQGADWPDEFAITMPEDPDAEKDPRVPIQASAAEKKAVEQLAELGVQVRPVAMNVAWTLANFRGIESNHVGKALTLLKDVQTMEDLNLAGLALTDNDLKHLSGLVNLTHLHLEKTPITDAGLAHLARLEHLKYLNLYATRVSDNGLESLKALKKLKNLYVWQTQVTKAGADALKGSLPGLDINLGWEATVAAKTDEDAEPKEETRKDAPKTEEKKDN